MNKINYTKCMLTITLLSLPLLYVIDRGNYEAFVFIFIAQFILCFYKRKYNLAAIFLSIAIGFKFYPIVFSLLFLKRKRYKSFLLCIFLFVIVNVLILCTLHGGFLENINAFIASIKEASSSSYGIYGVRGGENFMALVKLIYIITHSSEAVPLSNDQFMHFVYFINPYYKIISLFLIGMLFLYMLFLEESLWKLCLILVAIMILFPEISYSYKLIHLFIPLILFICSEEDKFFDRIYLILFIILIVPKNYFMFTLNVVGSSARWIDLRVSVAMILDVCTMSFFVGLIVYQRLAAIRKEKVQVSSGIINTV